MIDGPKAVGKTETGKQLASSAVYLETDQTQRQLALADPQLVLEGPTPRLLDEWQTVPSLWNQVRHVVDSRQQKGQFILTGSASPSDDITRHTGTGRFARLRMHPLTLQETQHSSGEVSLKDVLDGTPPRSVDSSPNLTDIVERMIIGGWPMSHNLSTENAGQYAKEYLKQIARLDIAGFDGSHHNPTKVLSLLTSLARNTATEASISTLAADAGGSSGPLHRTTVDSYLNSLERVYILEIQKAWSPKLRSRTPLREAPKRHLVDTSLVAAALGIRSPQQLLGDPETLGLLFESLAVQQLRAFADLMDAEVFHFRAKNGLEVDAIVERPDGAWAAFEIKLGPGLIDDAAANLKKFDQALDQRGKPYSLLAVIVPTGPSYMRPDGIGVISLTTLGN